MQREALISALIGELHPHGFPDGSRLRCNWIIRTNTSLPDQSLLSSLQQRIEQIVFEKIVNAYSSHTTSDQLDNVRPALYLLRIDDLHLLARIVFAGPEASIGDSALISQWGTLQAIAEEIDIDELQGLPRSYWFPLAAGAQR